MNLQLTNYIKQARQAGLSDEQIRENLKTESGWKEHDITEAFQEIDSTNSVPQAPSPSSGSPLPVPSPPPPSGSEQPVQQTGVPITNRVNPSQEEHKQQTKSNWWIAGRIFVYNFGLFFLVYLAFFLLGTVLLIVLGATGIFNLTQSKQQLAFVIGIIFSPVYVGVLWLAIRNTWRKTIVEHHNIVRVSLYMILIAVLFQISTLIFLLLTEGFSRNTVYQFSIFAVADVFYFFLIFLFLKVRALQATPIKTDSLQKYKWYIIVMIVLLVGYTAVNSYLKLWPREDMTVDGTTSQKILDFQEILELDKEAIEQYQVDHDKVLLLHTARLAIEIYYDDTGHYPLSDDWGELRTVLEGGYYTPEGVLSSKRHKYTTTFDGTKFILSVRLTNSTLPDLSDNIDEVVLGVDCAAPVYCLSNSFSGSFPTDSFPALVENELKASGLDQLLPDISVLKSGEVITGSNKYLGRYSYSVGQQFGWYRTDPEWILQYGNSSNGFAGVIEFLERSGAFPKLVVREPFLYSGLIETYGQGDNNFYDAIFYYIASLYSSPSRTAETPISESFIPGVSMPLSSWRWTNEITLEDAYLMTGVTFRSAEQGHQLPAGYGVEEVIYAAVPEKDTVLVFSCWLSELAAQNEIQWHDEYSACEVMIGTFTLLDG